MKKIKKVMATVLLLCMISSMLVVPAAASEITASEISLNFMGKTLAVGGTVQLMADFEPEGAAPTVKWESDNAGVATVDENGNVTAIANGTAVIKASVYEGQPFAECAVTVVTETPETPIVPVASISLGEQTSLNLEPNGTAALVATVAPENATNKYVAWLSSDENIVTVDENGVVTAHAAGFATVSAIAADVDLSLPAEQLATAAIANCAITVSEPYVEPAPEVVEPTPEPYVEPAPVVVPATAVYIDPAALTLTTGESATVNAAVNAEATDQSYYWASENEAIAKVENGTVTAVSAGVTNIYAVANGGSGVFAACAVTVNDPAPTVVPATAVYIDPAALTLTTGESATVSAAVNAEATDQSYYWASENEAIAKVENGTVTAVSAGVTNIYAVANGGSGVFAACAVTVNDPAPTVVPATAVYIDPAALTLTTGESATVSAAVNAEATDQSYYWASENEAIAKVENGTVTAVSAGVTNIYAVANGGSGVFAACAVTVNDPAPTVVPATSVTLEPNISEFSMKVGEYVDFTAAVNAEATDKSYYWYTDDPAVATVENGRVTGIASGRTTIYAVATGDTAYAACTVIVAAEPTAMFAAPPQTGSEGGGNEPDNTQQPAPVDVTPTAISLSGQGVDDTNKTITYEAADINKSYELTANHTAQSGGDYSWTVSGDAVSLTDVPGYSAKRTVNILKSGTADITIGHPNEAIADTTFNVTVKQPSVIPVTGVSLDQTTLTLTAGENATLTANVNPSDATDKSVTWSSGNETVATVVDGVVTAVSAGDAIITVSTTDGGYSATCAVTVNAAPVGVESIVVTPSVTEVINGEYVTFSATVKPDNATNKNVAWSITGGDEFAGDISYNTDGTVTVKCTEYASSDSSFITVSAKAENSSVTGSSSVKVLGVPAVNLVCVNDWASLTFNSNETPFSGLSAKLSRGEPVEHFVWASSNENVVKVLTTGTDNNAYAVIQIVGVGDAEITASYRGVKSAAMPVKVQNNAVSVTSVTMANALNLTPGAKATLHATVLPDNATDRTLVWESDNASVTVDNNGNVEVAADAQVNTTANITARATDGSEKYATCVITIRANAVDVTSVTIQGNPPSLTVGQTTSLGVTVKPDNATNKAVVWESMDPAIATVDQNGFITAKSAGQTKIVARSIAIPSIQSSIDVYVSNAPATTGTLHITASPQTITSTNGYSVLTATVNGYVINGGVNWSVSDTNMASVSSNGVVTAKRAGSFVVTGIYDNNGTRYTGTVLITATPVITSGNYSNYDGKNVMYFKTNQSYPSWRSTDIVSVDGMQLRHGQHCYVGSSPDGYVMVALNPQYLNTLPSSVVHTIRIGPASSPAVGYFRTYTGQGTVINGVMTGDENQAALWAALCFMGILGCATILVSRRKDWNS